MAICLFSFLFGVINVVVCIILCCISSCFLVIHALGWERTLICW